MIDTRLVRTTTIAMPDAIDIVVVPGGESAVVEDGKDIMGKKCH
jgi:hypothetical protein